MCFLVSGFFASTIYCEAQPCCSTQQELMFVTIIYYYIRHYKMHTTLLWIDIWAISSLWDHEKWCHELLYICCHIYIYKFLQDEFLPVDLGINIFNLSNNACFSKCVYSYTLAHMHQWYTLSISAKISYVSHHHKYLELSN